MKIIVFLPCRKGSQRVPKKNIKPFASFEHGLIEIKLKQLLGASKIDKIILSTNDEEIIAYAKSINADKLEIHQREESLAGNTTSTDDLVAHALELIPEGIILWTHVTSPFLDSQAYDTMIDTYFEVLNKGYDSLMSTSLIHGFLWNDEGPVNYDRSVEKWPRTQTITPLHEVNSAVFLNSVENYKNFNDRIGEKPYLYTLGKIESFDIDWEEDFKIGKCILESGIVTL